MDVSVRLSSILDEMISSIGKEGSICMASLGMPMENMALLTFSGECYSNTWWIHHVSIAKDQCGTAIQSDDVIWASLVSNLQHNRSYCMSMHKDKRTPPHNWEFIPQKTALWGHATFKTLNKPLEGSTFQHSWNQTFLLKTSTLIRVWRWKKRSLLQATGY